MFSDYCLSYVHYMPFLSAPPSMTLIRSFVYPEAFKKLVSVFVPVRFYSNIYHVYAVYRKEKPSQF